MRVVAFVLGMVASAALAHGASELAPGVDLIPGRFVAGTQPDGNTVVFAAPEGLVVFDTGRHPEHAREIVDFANAAKKPVAAIVNSHWHLDHVGGNVLLRERYPRLRVYASDAIEDAMHGFLANYHAQLEDAIKQAGGDTANQAPWRAELALIDAGSKLYPDKRITEASTRTIAGHGFRVGFESHAVTAGDVWLFDPASRVLASGDLVTLPAPLFDTACAERWKSALDRLAAIDFKVLVPGHGVPMGQADLATYRRAFERLLECAAGKSAKEACVDGWMGDAAPLIPAGDEKLARGLLDYYFDGILRVESSKAAATCDRISPQKH